MPTCPFTLRSAVALCLGALVVALACGQDEGGVDEEAEEPPVDEVEIVKQLTFIEEHFDTDAGGQVERLKHPYDVEVAPDGAHVYVASQFDDAVSIFARNVVDGSLAYQGDVDELVIGANALNGARSIAISPDGEFLYVASMFAGTSAVTGGALVSFDRNLDTGELAYMGAAYDTDPGVDGLQDARSVAISPDGKNLYVAAYGDEKLSVFSRNSLTGVASFLGMYQKGDQGVEELSKPQAVSVSPDGQHVYVALFKNEVVVFSRDDSTGLLTYQSKQAYLESENAGGTGTLRSMAVSPDGKYVYVASWNTDSLTVLERDGTTGALSHQRDYKNNVDGTLSMDSPHDLAISLDGRYVYVAAFSSDAVTSFRRDADTGDLEYFQSIFSEEEDDWTMNGPLSISVSPDGEHVYVGAGSGDHSLSAFRREALVDPPEFVVQPLSKSIEEGESVAFHALAQGLGVTYLWYRDEAAISGAELPVYTIETVASGDDASVYKVVATNAGGSVSSDEAVLEVLPPVVVASPTDLTALDISSNSARVVWNDASDNETSFELQRRTTGSEFQALATVLAGVSEYVDTGLDASTGYRYRVAAKRHENYSLWSNDAVIESADDTPQSPANLTLVSQTYNKTVLRWSDRSAVEDGFEIYRREADVSSSWEKIASTDANVNQYEDRAVLPSSTYAYRVRAFNESGDSDYTNSVVAITSAIPVNSITPTARSIPAEDVSGYSIGVSSGKAWEALSDVAWLVVTSPSDGLGTGSQSVVYRALLNEGQEERVGRIVVGGIEHTVTQAGSPPFLRVVPLSTELGAEDRVALVTVESNQDWAAVETVDWLTVVEGATGSGHGAIKLVVERNTNLEERSAVVAINDLEHLVTQAGAIARLELASEDTAFSSSGGAGVLTVTANVSWEASVSEDWIRLTNVGSGEGDGVLGFEVDENSTDGSRAAEIRVNEETLTITQEGAPLEATLPALEAPDFLTVDVSSGLGAALSWRDNSNAETGFRLRRAIKDTDSFVEVALLPADVTEFFDREAPRGKVVEYRLAAVDANTDRTSTEASFVSSLLPASNITAMVAGMQMASTGQLACANFSLEGEGRLTMTAEGFGPGLGRVAVGGPTGASLVEARGEISGPHRVADGVAVDWVEWFDLESTAAGDLIDGQLVADVDGLVYGARTEDGSEAFARGVAARGFLSNADAVIVAAFEIEGQIALPVMIRGIGPGLANQGAAGFASDPVVELYQIGSGGQLTLLGANDDWEAWTGEAPITLEDALAKAGSSPFSAGSKDALLLTALDAGRYVCVLRSDAGGGMGSAVLQVYDAR